MLAEIFGGGGLGVLILPAIIVAGLIYLTFRSSRKRGEPK